MLPSDFFDLEGLRFGNLFDGIDHVWEGLDRLPTYITDHLRPNISSIPRRGDVVEQTVVLYRGETIIEALEVDVGDIKRGGLVVRRDGQILEGATVVQAGAILVGDDIELGMGSFVEAAALIKGPTIIGDRTEVRHGAYVRGKALVGDGCVVGHATEMKATVMLGGSMAGHFAYLGDSILGQVNLGAGTKLANLKVFPGTVAVTIDGQRYDTGRRKFGAILGDGVELGCNSVTTPGTLMGPKSVAYPNTTIRGFHPSGTILK